MLKISPHAIQHKYNTFNNSKSSEITEEKSNSVFVTLIGMIIHSVTDGISFG